ncbi:MAG TPA: YbaB/EbfC family nucleoid-associated protein [Saprospiraceae bacterium]|nr:YbaB/EbfC family nucleoid-associated protein [Saprospiraceae bacterium]HMP14114.1 YbaB/EbfC family nucleoid-associated protein [Saprospiraceae bacterium]
MFGDLFGNMEAQQKELRAKLANIEVEAQAGDGAVKVIANANWEIKNIVLNQDMLDMNDIESLEDLLIVAINRALEQAAIREEEETRQSLQQMLPPGLSDMFR